MGINKRILTLVLIFALTASLMTPLLEVKAQGHTGLFDVTIIAPGNANLLRRQWSQVFASNLEQLGINAKVVYLDWTSVYDRALTPSADMVGKTYDQGGYDILALGWTPGLIPERGKPTTEATQPFLLQQDKTIIFGMIRNPMP